MFRKFLFGLRCGSVLLLLAASTTLFAATTVVDDFSAGTLDSEWTLSEIGWNGVTGDTSWNATDNAGKATGRRTNANAGTYNTGAIMRLDQNLGADQTLLVDFSMVDPNGQAEPDNRNNSFFGLAISAYDNSGGEFGANRFGVSSLVLLLDPRGRRAQVKVIADGGGGQSEQLIDLESAIGLTYDDFIMGFRIAIYRETDDTFKYFVAVPEGEFVQVGDASTVILEQMDAGFGGAIGIFNEWTGDFANGDVEAIYDNLSIMDGAPGISIEEQDPGLVDDFTAGPLDPLWIFSEVPWQGVSGDVSHNLTDNPGALTMRRTNENVTTYNEAFLMRQDFDVNVGQALVGKVQVIDPNGMADQENENNSFFGLVIAENTNDGGQWAANRHGVGTIWYGLDPRTGPRILATARISDGTELMEDLEPFFASQDGRAAFELINTSGIWLAIYLENETTASVYMAEPESTFQKVGSVTYAARQSFDAVGIVAEWTGDFANGNVEAVFDNLWVIQGEPNEIPSGGEPVNGACNWVLWE